MAKFTAQEIEDLLSELKVDSRGYIRGKRAFTDKIHSMHLMAIDSIITDLRIEVMKLGDDPILKTVDEILYEKQV